jgi:hypothetical protein
MIRHDFAAAVILRHQSARRVVGVLDFGGEGGIRFAE